MGYTYSSIYGLTSTAEVKDFPKSYSRACEDDCGSSIHVQYMRLTDCIYLNARMKLLLVEMGFSRHNKHFITTQVIQSLQTEPDSSVAIATCYGLDGSGSIPGRERDFSPQCPDRLWGPTNLLYNGCRGFLPQGVKRQGCETDHAPPFSAEVKNGGA
jgi:hypothetical protein